VHPPRQARDPLGRWRLLSDNSVHTVGPRRARDPALGDTLRLLLPPMGNRYWSATCAWAQGQLQVSPTRQSASVRGALRCACWRVQVDADLRSCRRLEHVSWHVAATRSIERIAKPRGNRFTRGSGVRCLKMHTTLCTCFVSVERTMVFASL